MGMDLNGIKNKEAYFRANVWGWRPIHAIINFINDKYGLGINTENFGFNDGAGVQDPKVCLSLKECIEKELEVMGLVEDSDILYLCLGGWCDYTTGEFIQMSESKKMGLDDYNGKAMLTPVSISDGRLVVPAHSVNKEHIKVFCRFLEECGGFEIW